MFRQGKSLFTNLNEQEVWTFGVLHPSRFWVSEMASSNLISKARKVVVFSKKLKMKG